MKKKYIWTPLAFLCVGITFYAYYGITMNAWMQNLSNILGYAAILIALSWALKKKEKLAEDRNDNYNRSYRNAPKSESCGNNQKTEGCGNGERNRICRNGREIMKIVESVENHKRNLS